MTKPALVILDRDGVINHDSPNYIKSAAEWQPIDGSLAAIARMNQAGIKVCLATNQAGLGRGLFTYEAFLGIQAKFDQMLAACGGHLDAVFFAPQTPADNSDERKPGPGMLLDASRRFGIALDGIPFVGDSLRDLQAGQAAGAVPVLLRTGNGTETEPKLPPELANVAVHDDLAAFVASFLGR